MFPQLIEKLVRHEDLTTDEAAQAMREVMEGRAAPGALAGLLAALVMKGERPEEIAGLARTMREHAVPLTTPPGDVFDTCGTGGDRSGHVQCLVGGCRRRRGVRREGGEARQSIGVEPLWERGSLRRARRERRGAAADRGADAAQREHRVLLRAHVPSVDEARGTHPERDGDRTTFNLLGPLTNPAGATRQIVGVPRPELTQVMARALMLLGAKRAWVVHGAGGIDEISTTGHTKVSECRDGAVHTFFVHPG